MTDEQEIERMAKKICKSSSVGCNFPTCSKCGIKDTCKARIYATRAVNIGYGDKKQAVKEAFEKLNENLAWGKPLDEYEYVKEQIDELFTKLYGADE